ncbi:MAG: hypothetical protein JSW64_13145 [Candidatus Zixiibacteriota bacterium]|nr:MAG: hypothetical protein JSW64_13145 [candidate division Zixibacteria bacterium]
MPKRENIRRWVVEADLTKPRIANALQWLEREQDESMLTNVNQLVKLIEEVQVSRENRRGSTNPFR